MSKHAKRGLLGTLGRLVRRTPSKEQLEIKRLRGVLHSIADSQPWKHMDAENAPALVDWICDTCRKARVGCYPQNASGQPRLADKETT